MWKFGGTALSAKILFVCLALGSIKSGNANTPCVKNCPECTHACNSNAICVGNSTSVTSCSCLPGRRLLTPCGGDAFAFCRQVCQQCPDLDHCPQAAVYGCPSCRSLPGTGFNIVMPNSNLIAVLVLKGIAGIFVGHFH